MELNNARIVLYAVRGTQRTSDSFYFQFWGSTLSIAYTWDETFYEFTCTSSVQGAGMTTGETTSGGSYTATITGLSSLSNITIKDNGTDVTSTFTKSGNNYVKTYSNVSEDHVLTIQSSSSPTVNGYVKKNSQYKPVSNTYQKNATAWQGKTITSVMWKINGSWVKTTSPTSGITAIKLNEQS